MKTILSFLDRKNLLFVWGVLLLFTTSTVILSLFFDSLLNLDIFYSLPISVASWYGSKKTGILFSLIAATATTICHLIQDQIGLMNTFLHLFSSFVCFSTLATLITNFRNVHRAETIKADTDSLTNIQNSRGFYVELANELVRSTRHNHVFSLAYIDIDNFKLINDQMGHNIGDQLLIVVANCLQESLRSIDVVARIGGDEFSCLLPETDEAEAKEAFSKVSCKLEQLMAQQKWPVSFSVGLVTFKEQPSDIKEVIKIADDLMYSVKKRDKNNVHYQNWCNN